jgi:tetratricopeptide (TPR) repeat protein
MARSPRHGRDSRASARDRLATAVLRSSTHGPARLLEIYRLRARATAADLFAVFPRIFPKRESLEPIHGNPLPVELRDLYAVSPLGQPVTPLNEVVWAISRCIQFGPELRAFTAMRVAFETYVLQDAKDSAAAALVELERQLGQSSWLVQQRLAIAQHWHGIDESRSLRKRFAEQVKQNSLLHVIIVLSAKRVEATGLKEQLKKELLTALQANTNPAVAAFLEAKVFSLWDIGSSAVAATLSYEAQSSIIDYYESLVCILQCAASDQAIPPSLAKSLEKPLHALYRQTADARLPAVMRGLGIPHSEPVELNPERASVIEAYSQGDYSLCVDLATRYLANAQQDLPVHVLALKASLHGPAATPSTVGILADVLRDLKVVIQASKTCYHSAFNLLKLCERFYGQNWAAQLRATVLFELREESTKYPPTWLRDIFVRDTQVSPFSAVAASGPLVDQILNDATVRAHYPSSLAVVNAMLNGVQDPLLRDPVRRQRYLGRFYLQRGEPDKAIACFSQILESGLPSERLRAAGAVALALIQKGRAPEAVDTLVHAHLRNPDAATLLPIDAVVKSLGAPSIWPPRVTIPLLLDLQSTHHAKVHLPTLGVAFERFQTANSISDPDQLLRLTDALGRDVVVAYLAKIWRPEIMKHTILYAGTREIESARIRVCQVLAQIDIGHRDDYLSEIKDRTKLQSLLRATRLIEQSKVYVDIQAIKKALRQKLGDSYARYRGSFERKPDAFIYQVADLIGKNPTLKDVPISRLLSTIHVVASSSETDVQFAAIFDEITNEFLKGDYGLNAYLSTRVRHGTLTNILRKAVADEHLVTPIAAAGAHYAPNTFWRTRIGADSASASVEQALLGFSKEFDAVIDHVKNDLIQIEICPGISEPTTQALFTYKSSNLERSFFQHYSDAKETIDDLVDRCVNSLWEKTDDNLLRVQETLVSQIRQQLMNAFDQLSERVSAVDDSGDLGGIRNAIARAKTTTQNHLDQVIGWFKRSEVFDRPDYAIEFAVEIAESMIRNTISEAASWPGPTLTQVGSSRVLPGRTLDGMVDILYGLFENALRHSGHECASVELRVQSSDADERHELTVSNALASSVDLAALTAKVRQARDLFGDTSVSRQLAQVEGRSGLHKVWLTLNAPSFSEAKLEMDALSDPPTFFVRMSFAAQRVTNEDTVS